MIDRLSDADIVQSVSRMDGAIAIVDVQSLTVVLVTDGFKAICASFSHHCQWSDAAAAEPELTAALNAAIVSGKSASSEILIGGVERRVAFKFVDAHQVIVSVRSVESLVTNLHAYMQSRDSLFSTSRTISVSEMATTLAHELNTPIGTISNILRGVQLRLKKANSSTEAIDNALTRALEQTQFTQSIINRIRDFTQSRRPKQHVLDMREQLDEALSLLDWLLSHQRCQVDLQLPAKPVYIIGDATMLQQVLVNLFRNAVDAMEHQCAEQRLITIKAYQDDTSVTVSISDLGQGLGSSADTLFVPFTTTKAGGMGVGLNICRSFIELHQGRLWLSPNEGDGCTSFVELPVASNEAITQWSTA